MEKQNKWETTFKMQEDKIQEKVKQTLLFAMRKHNENEGEYLSRGTKPW